MATVRTRRARMPLGLLVPTFIGALLATTGVLVGSMHPAAACSCAQLTDDQAFAQASVVFVGDLVDSGAPPGSVFVSNEARLLTFTVSGVHKGEVYERQMIVTARDGMSCGLSLFSAGPYLVFARPGGSGAAGVPATALGASLCSGTRSLDQQPVPASLGAARAPRAGPSPTIPIAPPPDASVDTRGDDWDMRPFAFIVGAALVASIAWLFLRRHRH